MPFWKKEYIRDIGPDKRRRQSEKRPAKEEGRSEPLGVKP